MVLAYPTTERSSATLETLPEATALSRTQIILVQLIGKVRNLHDEEDLQCVAFLAAELGLLRPATFCFSYDEDAARCAPHSLVLRDALYALLSRRSICWQADVLTYNGDGALPVHDGVWVEDAVSWLGVLTSGERRLFAQAMLALHRQGVRVLAPGADAHFGREVTRLAGEGAEAVERRLSAVRRQLRMDAPAPGRRV